MTRRVIALLLVLVFVALLALSSLLVIGSLTSSCRFQARQWTALHKVIGAATEPPHLTAAQRRAFHVSKRELAASSRAMRRRLYAAQGDAPRC